jgi:ferritin-like metal-binding protein YciE
MELNTLRDVLSEQLEDLQSAEAQLVEALPKLAKAASSSELQEAVEHHLEETKGHLERVKEARGELGDTGEPEECKAMKGLIAEGEQVIEAEGDPLAKDAALIAAAQRVEHYEIAAYGTARTIAGQCDLGQIEDLMSQTLDEESEADKLLTKIATGGMFSSGVNESAGQHNA